MKFNLQPNTTHTHLTLSQSATSAYFLNTSRNYNFTTSLGKPVPMHDHSFSEEGFPNIHPV